MLSKLKPSEVNQRRLLSSPVAMTRLPRTWGSNRGVVLVVVLGVVLIVVLPFKQRMGWVGGVVIPRLWEAGV